MTTGPIEVRIFEMPPIRERTVMRTTRNGVFAKLYVALQATSDRRFPRMVPIAQLRYDSSVGTSVPLTSVERDMDPIIELVCIRHPQMKVTRIDWWGEKRKRLSTKENEDGK